MPFHCLEAKLGMNALIWFHRCRLDRGWQVQWAVRQGPWNAVASWVENSCRSVCLGAGAESDGVAVASHIDLDATEDMDLSLESLCTR